MFVKNFNTMLPIFFSNPESKSFNYLILKRHYHRRVLTISFS